MDEILRVEGLRKTFLLSKKQQKLERTQEKKKVAVDGMEYYGVTNLGVKPTIPGENQVGVETCLLQFDGDLYGKIIQVELCSFLRGERKFAGLEQLMHQMEADKKNAGLFFGQ